jgi:hypothetical protein
MRGGWAGVAALTLALVAAGCKPAKPPAPAEAQTLTLAVFIETPPTFRDDQLSAAYLTSKVAGPLHGLSTSERPVSFQLVDCDPAACRADVEVKLAVRAGDVRAYELAYEVRAGRSVVDGEIRRGVEHIDRYRATTRYDRSGWFSLAVGEDAEAVGARLAELVEEDLDRGQPTR